MYKKEHIPNLSMEEEREYISKAQEGCVESRNKIMYHNIPRVIAVASKYNISAVGIDMEDLVQVGLMSIIKAIETYDISGGSRFGTWVHYYIKGGMNRYLESHDVLLSQYQKMLINKYYSLESRGKTEKEMLEEGLLKDSHLKNIKESKSLEIINLDTKTPSGELLHEVEGFFEKGYTEVQEKTDSDILLSLIHTLLKDCDEKHIKMFNEHFVDGLPYTEVAKLNNVSHQYAHKTVGKLINKLRSPYYSAQIKKLYPNKEIKLSNAETQVHELLEKGCGFKEISERTNIKRTTVKNIVAKLGGKALYDERRNM